MGVEGQASDRVRDLFLRCARASVDERRHLLAGEGDREVRDEVLALLEHHDRPREILGGGSAGLEHGRAQRRRLPQRIGPYRVVGVLGSGAMSVVYEAEQERPSRSVALKVLQPALAASSAAKRLQYEAEIIARLQHAGIAQVYGSGMTEDFGFGEMPYFAMERIIGQSLTAYSRDHQPTIEQRCELLASVCDAVQHAHERGVIHRDLKPANVLVTEQGVAKVLDFGIARSTESAGGLATLQTNTGQLLGTLPYMSPEQLSGHRDIDGRVDVYALGVMLYELLAGGLPLPLDGLGLTEAVAVVRDQDPTSLGALDRRFRGDLETIVQKALAKEPSRRYLSAADLAADLRRYLRSEPVVARPQTALYQLRKFARRHRALVGGVATTFVALAVGLIGMAIYADRNRALAHSEGRLRGEAEASRDDLRASLYRAEMVRAGNALDNPSGERSIGELISHWLPAEGRADLRGWEWWFLHSYSKGALLDIDVGRFGPSKYMAWLPEGILTSGTHAGVGAAGRAALWSVEDGRLLAEHVDWRRWHAVDRALEHVVANVHTGLSLRTLRENREVARFHVGRVYGVAVHPDGSELAVTRHAPGTDDDREIVVLDVATGEIVARPMPGPRFMRSIEYSADGAMLAVASEHPNRVTVFDTGDWSVRQVLDWAAFPQALAWHPVEPLLVVGNRTGAVSVLDVRTGEVRAKTEISPRMVHTVAWDPHSDRVAFGGDGNTVWVWDVSSGQTMRLGGHDQMVLDCIWSPDGTRVASTAVDGRLRVWDVARPLAWRQLPAAGTARGRGVALAYRPDGMLACDGGGQTTVLDPTTGAVVEQIEGRQATWNHDGSLVAYRRGPSVLVAASAANADRRQRHPETSVRDAASGGGQRGGAHRDSARVLAERAFDRAGWARLAWHPTEDRLAVGCERSAYVWDPLDSSGSPVAWQKPGGLHHIQWVREGSWLLLTPWSNLCRLVDPSTGDNRPAFLIGRCNALIEDPMGGRLLTAGKPRVLRWFDLSTGTPLREWESMSGQVLAAAWSPDGRRIATGGFDRSVRLWDARTAESVFEVEFAADVVALAWSRDARQLAVWPQGESVQILDAAPR